MWSKATAILCVLLATSTTHQSAYGFSTPTSVRPAAKSLVSDVAMAWNTQNPSASTSTAATGGRCIVNGARRINGLCLSATDDSEAEKKDDAPKEEKEEEEPEFETESSTTGLFIPGFSDQVVTPEPEPTKPKPVPVKVPEVKIVEPAVIVQETKPEPIKVEAQPKAATPPVAPKAPPTKVDLPTLPKFSLPSFGSDNKAKPSPPKKTKTTLSKSKTEDAIAAAIGGALAGATLGLYADIATDFLMDTDLPAALPPAALGITLGVTAFAGASQDGFVGKATSFVFGRGVTG